MAQKDYAQEKTEPDSSSSEPVIAYAAVIKTTCDNVSKVREALKNVPDTKILYQKVSSKWLKIVEEEPIHED